MYRDTEIFYCSAHWSLEGHHHCDLSPIALMQAPALTRVKENKVK